MSFIVTFIAAVFVFSAVIAIHEFGHFAVAKLCGIRVNEFSIGMGPTLWKKVHKGTQYSLRALPGEDVSDIARSFGGGGHALASGCTIAGPYADSSRAMMNAMEKKLLK